MKILSVRQNAPSTTALMAPAPGINKNQYWYYMRLYANNFTIQQENTFHVTARVHIPYLSGRVLSIWASAAALRALMDP